jgi:hypothetical protein
MTENLYGVDADLIVSFLKRKDSVLSNKPRRMGRNDRKFGDERKSRLTAIMMNKKSSFDDEDFLF